MSALLISGAWINPWYTQNHYPKNGVSFGALASVASWSQTTLDPQGNNPYGFDKKHVDAIRSKIGPNAKVLISFGGGNAFGNLWIDMSKDPDTYSSKIIDFVKAIGADGIDYDYESELTLEVSTGLVALFKKVQASGLVQTLSVLCGSSHLYKPIIDAKVMDYVIVMCYNGGMFLPGNPSGEGRDWKEWMEIWKEFMGREQQQKLVIGFSINNSRYYATTDLVNKAVSLCKENSWAGLFFWWYSDGVEKTATLGDLIDQIPSYCMM